MLPRFVTTPRENKVAPAYFRMSVVVPEFDRDPPNEMVSTGHQQSDADQGEKV